ncbi:MAG TPA: hypothetical protein VL967_12465 [Terracidiphilus sp.]|nr:hypothetical protein [Terracidiphilus sp.]
MLLDLSRALSFLLCILSLCWAVMSAFFVPGSGFEDRLTLAFFRLGIAACACFVSGLLFSWPSRARRHQPLTSTLPVQLFFWAAAAILILFLASWYFATYPCTSFLSRDCNL